MGTVKVIIDPVESDFIALHVRFVSQAELIADLRSAVVIAEQNNFRARMERPALQHIPLDHSAVPCKHLRSCQHTSTLAKGFKIFRSYLSRHGSRKETAGICFETTQRCAGALTIKMLDDLQPIRPLEPVTRIVLSFTQTSGPNAWGCSANTNQLPFAGPGLKVYSRASQTPREHARYRDSGGADHLVEQNPSEFHRNSQ